MHRWTILAAAGASLALRAPAAERRNRTVARNVVLVHGLFADGSCWSAVIGRLQAAGLNVVAVQNPLTTLDEAADAVRRVLARMDGPAVLAGHSFTGTIISEIGVAPDVPALVFIAARAPEAGEDHTGLAKRFPEPPVSAGVIFDGDEGRLSEAAFLHDFAADVPLPRARILCATHQPFRKALTAARTTHAAWRTKSCYYAVQSADRTIDPDLALGSSHLSIVSHPVEVAALIELAAREG